MYRGCQLFNHCVVRLCAPLPFCFNLYTVYFSFLKLYFDYYFYYYYFLLLLSVSVMQLIAAKKMRITIIASLSLLLFLCRTGKNI